jgi:hypothetical protein
LKRVDNTAVGIVVGMVAGIVGVVVSVLVVAVVGMSVVVVAGVAGCDCMKRRRMAPTTWKRDDPSRNRDFREQRGSNPWEGRCKKQKKC